MTRYGGLRPIAGALEEISRSRGWERRLAQFRVFDIWDGVCGRELRGVAAPVDIRGRTLVVAVCDQVWVNQLSFMTEELRCRINEALGGELFSRLRLVVDAGKVAGFRPRSAPPAGGPVFADPGPGEDGELDKLLASVDDERVRRVFRKLWRRIRYEASGGSRHGRGLPDTGGGGRKDPDAADTDAARD